ncbi:hypothetical protein GCM10010377_80620 [Streptomyces viridiviolaceus]|uniref:ABC transporter permease n=1 Tax=Streptomyces viridiviolaceus TaxID=68282 RepID=A0ABW2EGF9_9ACTN|nr:ABC transporter permease [Streptomyces viridiviolaceus]GHB78346.1 hypothetical protein GCM10010377_80620 [Streptomyces viridiviolaceus]
MRAMTRWARADLRRHRGEALFQVLATVGIVASLLLAAALFAYATNPWQRVFTRSDGAHVWMHTDTSADGARLARIEGVSAVAGPYPTESVTLAAHGSRAAAELRVTSAPPSVGRPLLTSGRWLRDAEPYGVVLESSLARALLAGPGDTLTLPGTVRTLTVVGVADSAEPRYSPGERPGLVWASAAAVRAPDGQVTGLRLSDPAATDYTVQRAVTVLGASVVDEVSTWQQARAQAEGGNRLLGRLLGGFGLTALAAAGLAAHGAIRTRVRGHLRDIAVLKAIGSTPGQVVRIFVLQHLTYAVTGALTAGCLVELFGDRAPGRIGEAVTVWQELPEHTTALVTVPSGVVLFIGATTALAAWRAGRVPPVPGVRPAARHGAALSATARVALGRRLPPALVLGVHRAFTRRSRSLATVARLSLSLLLVVVAMSAWSTMEHVRDHPAQAGRVTSLSVHSDRLGEEETRSLLRRDPRVAAVYPGAEVSALVPGQNATIALRGLGTSDNPYPYALAEGRVPRGPHEAVAGQGLLDLLHARVGDWVRMTVGSRPEVLHIVGRAVEPENAGRVVSTSLDNLRATQPELLPTRYELRLRPGADAKAVADELTERARGQLDVYSVTDPASSLSPLRQIIAVLVTVLAFIGLLELLTLIGATVREGRRDLLALRAIGLTSRQTAAVTAVATACTTLAAVGLAMLAGLPLARWLTDQQGRATGIGTGLARVPSAADLLMTALIAVAGAAALAALTAGREARRHRLDETH